MFPVYLITCNHPNYGQYLMPYVGCCPSGKSVEERFKEHCKPSSDSPRLRNAVKKYGKEFFSVQQIDAGNTPEQCLELEKYWIKKMETFGSGYNMTEGGDSVYGLRWKHTEEWKAAQSNRMRGEDNHYYGRTDSTDARKKMCNSQAKRDPTTRKGPKGKPWSEARREAQRRRQLCTQ